MDSVGYWSLRAEGYSRSIDSQIDSGEYRFWLDRINKHLGTDRKLDILDIGCGPGFFPVVLGREGHRVTGIDITPDMVGEARKNCSRYGVTADLLLGDAQHLPFGDSSFDLVVSRNVVWNLSDPEGAYREWMRVIRPGGKLMLFDGNHYLYLYDSEYAKGMSGYDADRSCYGVDPKQMEDIAKGLLLSSKRRPEWDVKALMRIGAKNIIADSENMKTLSYHDGNIVKTLPLDFFISASRS